MKERIEYIDVLKGILIIMVVLLHVLWQINSNCDIVQNSAYSLINKLGTYAILPYYMSAFFVVTGFCSNNHVEFLPFLKKNIVTLLWPSLALGCEISWFIAAMFGSRMIYWLIDNKINNDWYKYFILLIVGLFAFAILYFRPSMKFWFLPHTCLMCLFLLVGNGFKRFENKSLVYVVSSLSYIAVIVVLSLMNQRIPYVVSNICVNIVEYPVNLILSITGTLTLWGIAKNIKRNKVLSFLGKNSLVIYLVHISIITMVISVTKNIFVEYQMNTLASTCLTIGICIITIALSSAIVAILNTDKLKWIIGKGIKI